jgi:hypothetical protein
MFRPNVAQIQFQNVVEIAEEKAVDYPQFMLRHRAEKKLKFVPAPTAQRVPFGKPGIYLCRSGGLMILDLPAESFGFLGDQAGADAEAGFESTKLLASGHLFSFLIAQNDHPMNTGRRFQARI